MRTKKPALIVTFATTTAAMRMERFCGAEGLAGRLIPLPREISAGCGLAWKAEPELREELTRRITAAGLEWETMRVIDI